MQPSLRNTSRLFGAGIVYLLLVAAAPAGAQQAPAFDVTEGDFVLRDFHFGTGEVLPELRLHYRTLGTPRRDAAGRVTNAVLLLHGTTGSGRGFLSPQFGGVLFAPDGLLDAREYFLILPDGIGHGRSSKPSDGLRAKFPRYDYDDMVRAQHRLLTEHLGVNHLRLILGTSMGCMHAWVWGYTYPEFLDAMMPLACNPVEIAGRNRMMRKMILDSIRRDPEWQNGEYTSPPAGMRTVAYIFLLMTSSPLQMQKNFPAREAADQHLEEFVAARVRAMDPNDTLYAFDSSRNYNPRPHLEAIRAHVTAINSADDIINPPELAIVKREIQRVQNGRFVLLPVTDETRGHGTHSLPRLWQRYLAELLAASEN